MKALFIPLKAEYYNDFESGKKKTERRLYGKRWNEKTCYIGRPVTLSLGYSKKKRLYGTITGFRKVKMMDSEGSKDLLSCYGISRFTDMVAEIDIKIESEEE